ncbi:MAG: hypothetical protein WC479_08200 [Candidatus Izemoplasmatales bacterium]
MRPDKYDYTDGKFFAVYTEEGKFCSVQKVLYRSDRYVNLQSSGAFHRNTGIERGSTRYIEPATEEQIEQYHLLEQVRRKITWETSIDALKQIKEILE